MVLVRAFYHYHQSTNPQFMPLPFQGISAEHGIGQCKPQFLHLSKADSAVNLMKTLGWGKSWAP